MKTRNLTAEAALRSENLGRSENPARNYGFEEMQTPPLAPPQTPSTKPLNSASAVIDALGGTKSVARLLDVRASSISNYRRQGFPHRTHVKLAKICERRGLRVAPNIFGDTITSAPAHWQVAPQSTITSTQSDLFKRAGFTPVNLPILQPIAPFIARLGKNAQLGEDMRRRLFKFTAPDGEELCLRPELTIPTILNLTRANFDARYCYEGKAFRYQPRATLKPEEFTQSGIEIFNSRRAPCDDEIEIISLITKAVQESKVRDYQIYFNDVSLFPLILTALGVPAPWTDRLTRTQATPRFKTTLQKLAAPAQSIKPPSFELLETIFPKRDYPQTHALLVSRSGRVRRGGRGGRVERANLPALSDDICERIARIANLTCPAHELPDRMADIIDKIPAALTRKFDDYNKRLTAMKTMTTSAPMFSAQLGRRLAYYTGFAFELRVPALKEQAIIGGGGRYDDLFKTLRPDLNAKGCAVGGALNLERVSAAERL